MLLPLGTAFSPGPGAGERFSPPTPEAAESRGRLPLQFRERGARQISLWTAAPLLATVYRRHDPE